MSYVKQCRAVTHSDYIFKVFKAYRNAFQILLMFRILNIFLIIQAIAFLKKLIC